MSRAYRISVRESVTRDIKASDEIGTKLELLEILSPEAMGDLLRRELVARGFHETDDGSLTRTDRNATVTVDPCNGEVTVKSEIDRTVTEKGTREASAWDDVGPAAQTVENRTREQLKTELGQKLDREQERLQKQASEKLERELDDLKPELGEIVNRVTREALKRKAAQMGTIQEISEDDRTGSMTIKVEV
jgi:FtsH ternary system domain X5